MAQVSLASSRRQAANSLIVTARGLLLFYFLFTVCCELSYAADPLPKEPVVVNGDRVEYFHEKKKVVGSGNISITYKDIILTCDQITVYLDTREAIAEGNVRVTQKDAYFTGEKINYNFEERKGTVLNGYLNAKPFYGRAQDLEKIANKDQFALERGYITTCDMEKPHYRVQSRQVKIYLDEKVVAKHITVYVGKYPVFYFPYYVQMLDQKKNNVTVMPGQSKEWGYYALTAYRYNIDDKNRGDLLLDYRSKKGLAGGVNHYYDTYQIGAGAAKFYYIYENDKIFTFEQTGPATPRYRVQVRHKWDLGENTDTLATMEFNKLSDKTVIRDYIYKEFEELGLEPDNYISLITQKENYTAEFLIRKRFDKFYTVVERLPEYRINIPNFKILKDLPVYYTGLASGVYLNQTYDNTSSTQKDVSTIRFDTYNQLSYAGKLFKSLYLTPFGGVRETFYSRKKWGDINQFRTIFNAGLDASIKFYRIFDVQSNFLGLDINKLRHIITPTANYSSVHQPTISPDNLNQFDAIDSIDTSNGVTLALENRLQTKRLKGENWTSVDLVTFIVSTPYNFRLKKDNWGFKSQKFETVDLQLELAPYPWLYALSKASVNTKRAVVETESVDFVAHHGDDWSIGIGQRYENTALDASNLMTFDVSYKINDKWTVRAYERFQFEKRTVEEQEYTIYRDLHCWRAELTYNVQDTGEMSFWFVLTLKAFPEYPIGFKRTYSHPRFGSIGP